MEVSRSLFIFVMVYYVIDKDFKGAFNWLYAGV